jgi:hypothetical protein
MLYFNLTHILQSEPNPDLLRLIYLKGNLGAPKFVTNYNLRTQFWKSAS